jgi:hypothetical protein
MSPYPGDIGNLYCPPGSTPTAIVDPTGGVVGYQCVYPDGTAEPPIPVTVPIPPPGYTPVTVATPSPPPVIRPSPFAPNPNAPKPNVPALPPIVGPQLFGGPIFGSPSPLAPVVSTSGGTSVTGDIGAEGPIYVNTTQSVNIADNSAANAVQSVASAVQQGIGAATAAANNVATTTAQGVADSINGYTTAIQTGVQNAFTSIGDIINGVETGLSTTLGGIGATIGTSINNALNPVSTGLGAIVQVISQQIGGLAGAIGNAVGAVIPAIIAAVTFAVSPSTAILQAISTTLSDSVTTLAQLGSDVSGGFASLDGTLNRILTNWETYNTTFVEAQTGWGDGDTAHSDLSKLAESLAGLVSHISDFNPQLADKLTTLCTGVDLQAELHKPVWDTSKPLWGLIPDYHKIFADIIIWVFSVIPAVQKITEETRQRMDQACPIDLLPPATLIEAWLRGYITEQQAKDEAGQGNLGASRMDLLKDLATHQMSPVELVEAQFRGIINSQDFYSALASQGWTGAQQKLLQALAVPQFQAQSSGVLNEALQRQLIDGPTFDVALKALNFDDAQRKLLAQLVFRPTFLAEAIAGGAAGDELTALGVQGVDTPPEYVQVAGANEGLSPAAVSERWAAHWQDGGVGTWLALYFRGTATLESLQAAMDRAYIPRGLQTAFIEASRPIPQFRTVGTMYRWGVLTYEGLIAQIKRHGFSDADAALFANFYRTEGPLPAAKRANTVHAVSVGIAKAEYKDGSISEQEYYQILLAHGFTINGANAEIAVENALAATNQRKINAQFVVDEYGAGLINEQQALAQLATQGLTLVELARYAHKIRAFRVSKAKIPSETDLHGMLTAKVITPTQYVDALEQSGYISGWAQSFLAWRTAVPSSTPVPATTPPTAPTGGTSAPTASP